MLGSDIVQRQSVSYSATITMHCCCPHALLANNSSIQSCHVLFIIIIVLTQYLQELIHKNEVDVLICQIDEKDEKIKKLEDLLARKDEEIKKMKIDFEQTMELKSKEVIAW